MTPSLARLCHLLALHTISLSLLCHGNQQSKESWKLKPYGEWTKEEVRAVLTESPWVKRKDLTRQSAPSFESDAADKRPANPIDAALEKRVEEASPHVELPRRPAPPKSRPVSSTSGQTSQLRHCLTVRWISAQVVRQALVRDWSLRGLLDEESAAPASASISAPPKSYVLGIKQEACEKPFLRPGNLSFDSAAYYRPRLELLQKTARLGMSPGKRVRPEKVIVAPREYSGVAEVLVYFPRQKNGLPTFSDQIKNIEFQFEYLVDRDGLVRQQQWTVTFDLHAMKEHGYI